MNTYPGTIIIAPFTSATRNYPTHIKMLMNNKTGMIVLDQIKTINKARLNNKIGKLNAVTISLVKQVIEEMLVK